MKAIEQYELATPSGRTLSVKWFGNVPYKQSFDEMLAFTSQRTESDQDQVWLLEHPKVYTQGTACDLNTLIATDIPVVKTDRGGQITFHGPGQIVMYPLLHLPSHKLGIKSLVHALEESVIQLLAAHSLEAVRKLDAPGVYINEAKVAALGLRIRKGSSYHGLSLNVNMDMEPFSNIDPCGYRGLEVCQLSQFNIGLSVRDAGENLARRFASLL